MKGTNPLTLPNELWEYVLRCLEDPVDHWVLWQIWPELVNTSLLVSNQQMRFPSKWFASYPTDCEARICSPWGDPGMAEANEIFAGFGYCVSPPVGCSAEHLQSLRLEDAEFGEEVWKWLAGVRRLREVYLQGQTGDIEQPWIPWLLEHAPNLEVLSINDTWVYDLSFLIDIPVVEMSKRQASVHSLTLLPSFRSLHTLSLAGCAIQPDAAFVHALGQMTTLRDLDLSYNWFSGLHEVLDAIEGLTQIERLRIAAIGCRGVMREEVELCLRQLPNLHTLGLEYSKLYPETLNALSCRQWKGLSLRGAQLEVGVNRPAAVSIQTNFIDISCVAVKLIEAIRPSSSWKHVLMEYCYQLPKAWLETWVTVGMQPEVLSFHGCYAFQEDTVRIILPCLGQLRTLHVEHTMTPWLPPEMPFLKTLYIAGSLVRDLYLDGYPRLRALHLGRTPFHHLSPETLGAWLRKAPWHHHVWVSTDVSPFLRQLFPDCASCLHLMA